jgi:peptidoglycan/LPS O-acetylase OafA/YrhL
MTRLAPPSGFIPRLESLRGLAALMVAGFHAAQTPWIAESGSTAQGNLLLNPYHNDLATFCINRIIFIFFNGGGAVNLFFVLSGFVLTASIMRDGNPIGSTTFRFIVARLCRLYPAIWATIPIYVAILAFAPEFSLTNVGLLEPFIILQDILLIDVSLNGVMWSLRLEVVAIPFVLGGALAARRFGVAPLVGLAALLLVLSFHGPWTRGFGPLFSLNPLFCFALGMMVPSIKNAIAKLSVTQQALILAIAAFLFFGIRPLTNHYRWITISEAFASAAIVSVVASNNSSRWGSFLDNRFVRFYGRISYSFYLVHPLSLSVIWRIPKRIFSLLEAGISDSALALILFVLSTLAVTPIAWLIYRYVEQPGIALGRIIIDRYARRQIVAP